MNRKSFREREETEQSKIENRNSKIRLLVVAVVAHLGALFAKLAEEAGLGAGAVTVAFDLLLRFRGVARERHGEQAFLGDRFSRHLAHAVRAVLDATDRGFDLGQSLLFARDE